MHVSIKTLSAYHNIAVRHTDSMQSIWLLAARLWMANIFWKSGLTKVRDWDSTIVLFMEEYKVPVLPPEIAAYVGTCFELICPILLLIGLANRLAVIPLLAMTAVIQLTYLQHEQHIYWAFLLSAILVFGAGKLSVDHWIHKRFGHSAG